MRQSPTGCVLHWLRINGSIKTQHVLFFFPSFPAVLLWLAKNLFPDSSSFCFPLILLQSYRKKKENTQQRGSYFYKIIKLGNIFLSLMYDVEWGCNTNNKHSFFFSVKLQTYFYRGFPGKNSLEKLPTDQLPKDYRSLKRCLKFAWSLSKWVTWNHRFYGVLATCFLPNSPAVTLFSFFF